MYFVSFDAGKKWVSSRCVTLYKVKETVVKGQTGQIYIGERHGTESVKPIMVGEKHGQRYKWNHVEFVQ